MSTTGSTGAVPDFGATLLRAAWLSILLGFAMEALLLLLAIGLASLPWVKPTTTERVMRELERLQRKNE
jgi:hypothetical protein